MRVSAINSSGASEGREDIHLPIEKTKQSEKNTWTAKKYKAGSKDIWNKKPKQNM